MKQEFVPLVVSGKELQDVRRSMGLKQQEVADQIGCSRALLSQLEHDKKPMVERSFIETLANLYDIPLHLIVEGEQPPVTTINKSSVKLGDRIVPIGSYLSIGEKLWQVIGDEFVVSSPLEAYTFDQANSPILSLATKNIGYRLEQRLLPTMVGFGHPFITHTWDILDYDLHFRGRFTGTFSFLSVEEYQQLKGILDHTDQKSFWLRTPMSTRNATTSEGYVPKVYTVDRYGEIDAAFPYEQRYVRVVAYLQPDVNLEGEGTKDHPFRLLTSTKIEAFSYDQPINVRGTLLQNLRKDARLSLEQVATLLGFTVAYLSKLENNKIANPSVDTTYKLSHFYRVPMTYLLDVDQIMDTQQMVRYADVVHLADGTKLTMMGDARKQAIIEAIEEATKEWKG